MFTRKSIRAKKAVRAPGSWKCRDTISACWKYNEVLEKVKTDGLVPTVEAVRSKLEQPLALGSCDVGVERVGREAGEEGREAIGAATDTADGFSILSPRIQPDSGILSM